MGEKRPSNSEREEKARKREEKLLQKKGTIIFGPNNILLQKVPYEKEFTKAEINIFPL